MKEKPPPSPRPAAVAVMDPDLAGKDRTLLERAGRHPRSYSEGEMSVWRATAPRLVRPGAGVVGLAGGAWVAGKGEWYDPGVFDTLHAALAYAWPLGAGTLVLAAAAYATDAAARNKTARGLAGLRDRCVRPAELHDDASTLLARAQQAKRAVLTSAVHRFDLIDRQRNEVSLPRQEWEIAVALREYTRLVKAEPSNPRGDKVAALLDTRRRALQACLDGITQRVVALEGYALRVAETDRQYRELQQVQALAAGGSDVLELLARTVRDDLAVAEIEGMTGEAAVVAASFATALESAKEAAAVALPARTAAA